MSCQVTSSFVLFPSSNKKLIQNCLKIQNIYRLCNIRKIAKSNTLIAGLRLAFSQLFSCYLVIILFHPRMI